MREKFRSQAKADDQDFSLDVFVPMPAELKEDDSATPPAAIAERRVLKYGFSNWYDWAFANWGTKWHVDHEYTQVTAAADGLEFIFYTAWGPPEQWLRTVARMFPDLRFVLHWHDPNDRDEARSPPRATLMTLRNCLSFCWIGRWTTMRTTIAKP